MITTKLHVVVLKYEYAGLPLVKGLIMDDPTCHDIFGIHSVEENTTMGMEALQALSGLKSKLDRPLVNFTAEDVCELAEHVRAITQELFNLPPEILDSYICSRDIVFQHLEDIVIELNLALDQLSISGEKAVFYRHLLVSQKHYSTIFTQGLSKIGDDVVIGNSTTPVIDLSSRAAFNYKLLVDFSRVILPNLYSLFQGSSTIKPAQCTQAITDIERLEMLIDKQKVVVLHKKLIAPYESEYAELACWLTVALAYAGELAEKLIKAISTYQSRGRSKSRMTLQLREEIVYYLTLFNRHFEKVLKKIEEMKVFQNEEYIPHWRQKQYTEKIISFRR